MNNIPKKIKEKIKDHQKYKDAQEKQEKLEQAANEIKKKKLQLDWKHVGNIVVAIGIVIACTATVFFPGDDIAAWLNLFRLIGC